MHSTPITESWHILCQGHHWDQVTMGKGWTPAWPFRGLLDTATAVETPPVFSGRQKTVAKDGLSSGKGTEPWRLEPAKREKIKVGLNY